MANELAHIIIVDDDREIRLSVAAYLRTRGFRVSVAAHSKELDHLLATMSPDLIVLDIMMPGEDGLNVCRRLQASSQIPIILLTALTDAADRVVGLELGADDYIAKPFDPRELVARIRSVIRRSRMLPYRRQRRKGLVRFDRWRFDLARRELLGEDDVAVKLSSGEHLLLVSLIEHAGCTLTRDQLLDLTKGRDAQPFDRSVDNQISRLRRKVEADPKNPRIILTQWGGGYLFAAEVEWVA